MFRRRVVESGLKVDPGLARDLLKVVQADPVFPGVEARRTTVFASQACEHCGGLHDRTCPRVRRVKFSESGRPVEVEFWPAGEWPADEVLWLADVQESAAAGEGDEQDG